MAGRYERGMLRLTLNQFRGWDQLQIEAPVGAITLIKGPSGIGKTTIFQAIAWCLYKNVRSVHPTHLDPNRTQTCVTLELPYTYNGISDILRIERSRHPNRLIIQHPGLTHQSAEDKIAQALIDDLFGPYEVWLISCYIGQKCRNNFITSTNAGKMDLLNKMAFHEDDPRTYLERIDSEIGNKGATYRRSLADFMTHLQTFEAFLGATDTTAALPQPEIEILESQRENLKTHLETLKEIQATRQIKLGILQNLDQQMITLQGTIREAPVPDPNLIQYKDVDLRTLVSLLERRDTLRAQIGPETGQDPTPVPSALQDYQQALAVENERASHQRVAHALQIGYDQDLINTAIQAEESLIQAQDRIKLQTQLQTLKGQALVDLPEAPPPIVARIINPPDDSKYATEIYTTQASELSKRQGALQVHMEHLRTAQQLLACPHCDRPVRLDNGILIGVAEVPSTHQLEAAQLEYETLGTHLVSIQNYIQALHTAHQDARRSYETALKAEQSRLDGLKARHQAFELEYQRATMARLAHQQQVNDLETALGRLIEVGGDPSDQIGPVLSPSQLQHHYNLIASLRTIKIIAPPPYSSAQIEAYRQFEAAAIKRTELREVMDLIPPEYHNEATTVLRKALTLADEYERRTQIFTMEEAKHNHLQQSYQSQIETITRDLAPDPRSEIEATHSQIEAVTQKLELSQRAHRALTWHAQITLERTELVALDTMVADLQVLRQYTLKTECIILQQVVDTINTIIEDVCSTLFDRDINITLRLDKLLKSTKNIKQEVNFIIEYQGGTYEALSQLSGGEEDRVSLALTLALNRLSACPILMLDELLGSLDTNTKDAAIRTIREQTNHTVLVIMHGGVEGIFDAVIDCEELR